MELSEAQFGGLGAYLRHISGSRGWLCYRKSECRTPLPTRSNLGWCTPLFFPLTNTARTCSDIVIFAPIARHYSARLCRFESPLQLLATFSWEAVAVLQHYSLSVSKYPLTIILEPIRSDLCRESGPSKTSDAYKVRVRAVGGEKRAPELARLDSTY